jgi:hypothetical protein
LLIAFEHCCKLNARWPKKVAPHLSVPSAATFATPQISIGGTARAMLARDGGVSATSIAAGLARSTIDRGMQELRSRSGFRKTRR